MSDEVVEREIDAEQAFVDKVYRQLEVSADAAQRLAKEGHDRGRLGHEGGLVERDAMVFHAARRIAQLDAAHEGLVFGRLDLRDEVDPEPRYVGRIGLRDTDRDSLLIDWRAPAAAVFYQATAAEPHDVVRRRVLRCTGPRVIGVEDELLDAEALEGREADLPIIGEGALMAQLSRARDRSMHSIVATIQAEQDKAIRAPGQGRRHDQRRPGHRQDGGRAAPRGVPALQRPAPLRERRGADRRPQWRLHALHRAGAPVARRDGGRAALPRRGRRRRQGEPPGRAGRRRRQGLGADGHRAAPGRTVPGAGQPHPVPGVLARRRDPARPRHARAGPPPADVAGSPQPADAACRQRAARPDVAPGPRRARVASGVATRSTTTCSATSSSSTSCWPGGRRSRRPTCSAGCATPTCWRRCPTVS